MSGRVKHAGFGLALLATLALVAWRHAPQPPPVFAEGVYRHRALTETRPEMTRGFITPPGHTASVHAGTLVERSDGSLLAAWFGGTREGAKDVAIYSAAFDPTVGHWSEPVMVTDRLQSQRELQRYLRKLGNPVLGRDAEGRIWLFYVTVSLGGWATSSVSYKVSEDGGRHWSEARRLVTSPLANLSTLVKGRPLLYRDGSLALPAYHELQGKFGELLRISPSGGVLDKWRMTAGRRAIQPWIVPMGGNEALALMRRAGSSPPRVLLTRSRDAGASWGELSTTSLPNPGAAVAAALRPDGSVLLVFNDREGGRENLSLALSRDGEQWKRLAVLEQGERDAEFSYPYLIHTAAGGYHIAYTWRRERIAHVFFNEAWIEGRL
jgi:predicted neuraminidase